MTEKRFYRQIRRVTPYTPGEQIQGASIIKLNTNENPYPPSPRVAEAISAFDTSDLRLYPDPNVRALKESIARVYGVSPDQVFVGVGSDDVLSLIFQTFFSSDLPILFPNITYSFYPVWANLYGINYREIPLKPDFTLDPSDYSGDNGGILFPNPNAPTGLALGLDAIRTILSHNPESLVVVDEAYVDFGATSAVPLLTEYENLLVVQTFSKSRSLAGARLAFALSSPRLIQALDNVKNSINSYTINRLSLAAGIASINDTSYLRETSRKIIDTRESAKRTLSDLGFTLTDSAANFLFATHPALSARDLYLRLKTKNILVRWFDSPLIRDYLRITIGTPDQMSALYETLQRILSSGAT